MEKLRGMPIPECCKELNEIAQQYYDDGMIMRAVQKYQQQKQIMLISTARAKRGYFWKLQAEDRGPRGKEV